MRIKAALALALLYAFCVLAPPTALVLGDAAKRVHCLTETHGMAPMKSAAHDSVAPHDHGVDAGYHHAAASGAQNDAGDEHNTGPGKCCGMFCLTAIAQEPSIDLLAPPPVRADFPVLVDAVLSRGPDRIIRPPIA